MFGIEFREWLWENLYLKLYQKHPVSCFYKLPAAVTTASQAEALLAILQGWEELFEAKKAELVQCNDATFVAQPTDQISVPQCCWKQTETRSKYKFWDWLSQRVRTITKFFSQLYILGLTLSTIKSNSSYVSVFSFLCYLVGKLSREFQEANTSSERRSLSCFGEHRSISNTRRGFMSA